jgi:hypothetical protein
LVGAQELVAQPCGKAVLEILPTLGEADWALHADALEPGTTK